MRLKMALRLSGLARLPRIALRFAAGDVKGWPTACKGQGPYVLGRPGDLPPGRCRCRSCVAMLDDRTRSQLAQVDHRDHEALTAVSPDGAVVEIARYIRLQRSSTAEVAVAVADHWRGRGIATLLLQQIAARARAAGIDRLTALCLASNTVVLGLLSRLGQMTITPPEVAMLPSGISQHHGCPFAVAEPGGDIAVIVDADTDNRRRPDDTCSSARALPGRGRRKSSGPPCPAGPLRRGHR